MLEKWKNDPEKRDKLMKAAAVLIILAASFIAPITLRSSLEDVEPDENGQRQLQASLMAVSNKNGTKLFPAFTDWLEFLKWKNDPEKREKLMKAAAVLIILAVLFLSFDVFTQNRDGRKQIIDSDGGTETELCSILSDIDGVGAVDVMLQYGEKDQVAGVIVTAEGAGDPVVKNDLIKAVMAVFDISSANVEVFEKTSASDKEETNNEQ